MSMFGSTNILQLQEHWTKDQTNYFWEKLDDEGGRGSIPILIELRHRIKLLSEMSQF